jgi:N-glycosidase YbiA
MPLTANASAWLPNPNKPKLGMTRQIPIRPDWDQVKDAIMYQAVRKKFETHNTPRALLLGTWPQDIVENAPMDAYWGCGPDGQGLNKLGQILMRVREELRGQS